ncbi:MAG TPA: ATP-binding protein, partial [Motilibacteraceae bacterium]|nr:ATP-binding protein [Motilibacteraceae bacterium]
ERLAWVTAQLREAHVRRRPATARSADDPMPVGDRLGAAVRALAADHLREGVHPSPDQRWAALARTFGLDGTDVDLLTAAVAADVDPNAALALGLLRGSDGPSYPAVATALELAGLPFTGAQARSRLGAGGALVRHRLVEVGGDAPFPARLLRAPERLVAHLAGDDAPDARLAGAVVDVVPAEHAGVAELAAALRAGAPLCWVHAPVGSAGTSLAAAGLAAADLPCLAVRLPAPPPPGSATTPAEPSEALRELVEAALLEAALSGAGLVLDGAQRLAEEPALVRLLEQAPVPVVAVGTRSWDPAWSARLPLSVTATTPVPALRRRLWSDALSELNPAADPLAEPEAAALLSLRLGPEDVDRVVRHASDLADARERPLDVGLLREAARRLSVGAATGTGRPRTRAGFEDLVLPDYTVAQLRRLVSWGVHRDEVLAGGDLHGKGGKGTGITAMFTGSPGTGKTLAAHVVGDALGLDLLQVDLSTVVDKYIGETEKNLEKVFAEAENLNVVLFFDEADSLFGSRSEVRDARDRYANLEVSYLLQRMEQFDGIAILATNLSGNLDPAFSRRLHFVVHFPDPDVDTRRQLWERHLAELPGLDPDDPPHLDTLAEQVQLAGGGVRNVVLAAAYAAVDEGRPVGMRHLAAAALEEYRKTGRHAPESGFLPVAPASGSAGTARPSRRRERPF